MIDIEKQLLNIIQSDFPITSKPYENFADQLGLSEGEVINLIEGLKKRQIIRRVGAIFDLEKLGYKSTLCAMKVPSERLDEVAETVNSYSGVTHNYGREHEFNLWFTLIAENEEKIIEIIEEIKAKTGVQKILSLPAINLFKINVDFKL
jgi:DNA-binding Lrp family transcriptional regulator